MDWFENWFGSPFYRILYQNRDDDEAQRFIENLLGYLKPLPAASMLDIACGEGRFAVQLAEKGFDVTGIDISHASIELAKAFEQENLRFYVQDMRFPFCINYFDYAFNFFTSFGYFRYDRDHSMAARSFAAALKKGGTLVIDYLNYQHVLGHLVPESKVKRGDYTFNIKKKYERRHIIKDIDFEDADKKHRHFRETVATFSLEDFVKLFANAGMELVQTFGDYDLNAYHPIDTPRMIMIFKKN